MKNKSSLNNEEKPSVEQQLLPRLNFMGYVMCSLALSATLFAILAPKTDTISPLPSTAEASFFPSDEDESTLNPTEVLNFYVVSGIFAAVGASCFLIAWKKKKKLKTP